MMYFEYPKLLWLMIVPALMGMPKWKPGKQRGKAVRVSYNLPVRFKLN